MCHVSVIWSRQNQRMAPPADPGYALRAPADIDASAVLTPSALTFLAALQLEFGRARAYLLEAREARQAELDAGQPLDFSPATRAIREDLTWQVPAAPADLADRRCEITGPTDARMLINALNSGAKVFMADFEDATAPTWGNLIDGQLNLTAAIRRELTVATAAKTYELNAELATLVVRPRGWHLPEKHLLVDRKPMSGSLFDAGLYLFRNAALLLERGSGPYFYLPKLQAAAEAGLWADVFAFAEQWLQLPRGSVRATVLVETLPMAFQMEETLHALGPYASGLNAGRWDYMFSAIKTFRARPKDMMLPDRNAVTMTAPFMRAYTKLLVDTCHRRGAHAIGGMAAFIPSRRDAEVNADALTKVKGDKVREASDGFDGSWVAHPDLVPVCLEVFDAVLGEQPNQLGKPSGRVLVTAGELLSIGDTPGAQTEAGLVDDIRVGLHYIAAWLGGRGAVAISNLMEDAATAEIARSQVWQWVAAGVFTSERVLELIDQQFKLLADTEELPRLSEAKTLFTAVALGNPLADFLTLPGYELLV
jgi:malate synthase